MKRTVQETEKRRTAPGKQEAQRTAKRQVRKSAQEAGIFLSIFYRSALQTRVLLTHSMHPQNPTILLPDFPLCLRLMPRLEE